MELDEKKLSKAMEGSISKVHTSLCRAQLASFEAALETDQTLIVGCTQEAPLFVEIAEESKSDTDLKFVNIRENAGWSKEGRNAAPKMAALLRDAEFEVTPARLKSVHSNGICLVYGSGQEALEIAQILGQQLSVTLMLASDEDFMLPTKADIAIYRGDVVQASGSLGDFQVVVDNYAPLRPASRSGLEFAVARNGATSNCSLIFDLSGKTPLFPAHHHRDGYVHVDPGNPAQLLREAIKFMDLVGEFEKPIYVDYNAETCAHSRSQKVGCNKCLDVCPAGAISDIGDIVEIDNNICGGCGSCHSVCPTGSISYQYPARTDILSRVQHVVSTFRDAGGKNPVLLLHDERSGEEMIAAIARYGEGLPADVVPLGFYSVASMGHVELLGMLNSGAAQVLILTDANKSEELSGLETEIVLANSIFSGLELAENPVVHFISEADPQAVAETIWNLPKQNSLKTERIEPQGTKRDIARLVFSGLHKVSKSKPDYIGLPENAPYGSVEINQEACTLCMACTSACPASAIVDTPGEPKLRFTQASCVQCGLCVSTCPENALSLKPQLNFTPAVFQPQTLKEEEPFHCISCGVPFATRSTIERIVSQLAGKHSMFANEERSNLIKMCENCRVEAQANSSEDPFVVGNRPKPRTTEDYLAAEKSPKTADDFLIKD